MSKVKQLQDVVSNLRILADSIDSLITSINGGSEEGKEVIVLQNETQDSIVTENQLTLEDVRAVLAEKNRDGHREEIKPIIQKYGANKLTALDPNHYTSVLKEVGELQ